MMDEGEVKERGHLESPLHRGSPPTHPLVFHSYSAGLTQQTHNKQTLLVTISLPNQRGSVEDISIFDHQCSLIYNHKHEEKLFDLKCQPTETSFLSWWNDTLLDIRHKQTLLYTNGHSPPGSPKLKCSNLSMCERKSISTPEHDHTGNVVIQFKQQTQMSLDSELSGCISVMCRNSPKFCSSFLAYGKANGNTRPVKLNKIAHEKISVLKVRHHVQIILQEPKRNRIDYKWNYRVQTLVVKCIQLDDVMNWLNTLGGGYSALGDYYTHHAKEAGKTSLKQLCVAMEIGDPPTVIRCKLYFGLSLMQQGHLRIAKHIIRNRYREACSLPVRDSRLLAMCQGLWSRLGYLYSKRHKTKHEK